MAEPLLRACLFKVEQALRHSAPATRCARASSSPLAFPLTRSYHRFYRFAMKTTIDKAGRVVIPKALRMQFHLSGGTEVEIDADGDALRIRRPRAKSSFAEKEGVLVQRGEPHLEIDVAAFINQQRDARAFETAALRKSS